MKNIFVVGNWKSNKTKRDTETFFQTFSALYTGKGKPSFEGLTIVIAPPFVHLPLAKTLIKSFGLPISLAAQNCSPFQQGAYTGEVAAEQISEFADYVMIGHSERREKFREDDGMLSEKVKRAKNVDLIPMYCVPDEKAPIPEGVTIVAYEPVWAIGIGKAESPEGAQRTSGLIKKDSRIETVIYGGSVTHENVKRFINMPDISGVLPGTASLDPKTFWNIIINASI